MNVASVVEDDLTSLAKLYLCRMKGLASTEAVVLYFWGRETQEFNNFYCSIKQIDEGEPNSTVKT